MAQSLIEILNIWDEAVRLFDRKEWQKSISKFNEIEAKSSRHLYNVACCHVQLGQFEEAIQTLNLTLSKDGHLVIAHAQRALCNHQLKRYNEACTDLQKALTLIGTRSFISYQPMGLNHKLNNIEVTYNLAAVYSAAQEWDESRQWLIRAREGESRLGLAYIGKAIQDIQQHKPFEPLPLPTCAIFHPDRSMLANVAKKNYLGKAKVIAEIKVEVKDDSALRSHRLTVPTDSHKRSKSRDSILEASPHGPNRAVQLSPRMLRQLHMEMPRAPPPRLVKKDGKAPPGQEQDVRLYPLPPPPPQHSRSDRNGESKRSEEVRARSDGLAAWSDFEAMHAAFSAKSKTAGAGVDPLRVDNDPWRPVDVSQMSELESALNKQRSKMVG